MCCFLDLFHDVQVIKAGFTNMILNHLFELTKNKKININNFVLFFWNILNIVVLFHHLILWVAFWSKNIKLNIIIREFYFKILFILEIYLNVFEFWRLISIF